MMTDLWQLAADCTHTVDPRLLTIGGVAFGFITGPLAKPAVRGAGWVLGKLYGGVRWIFIPLPTREETLTILRELDDTACVALRSNGLLHAGGGQTCIDTRTRRIYRNGVDVTECFRGADRRRIMKAGRAARNSIEGHARDLAMMGFRE